MDNMQDIFKVIICGKVIGTAFAICNEKNVYTLLTAYHVVSEAIYKNYEILVEDEKNVQLKATVVFPKELSRRYRSFASDFAVMQIYSEKRYNTFILQPNVTKPCNCFIRGAVPHFETDLMRFKGEFLGEETIKGKPVAIIDLALSTIYDSHNMVVPEQQVLQGLSGSPVLVEEDTKYYCVGVIGNFERDSAGSKKYAVPSCTIIDEYIKPNGITFEKNGFIHTENIQYSSNIDFWERDEILIDLLFEDYEEFMFCNEQMDLTLWDKISNMFYRGRRIDLILGGVTGSEKLKHYEEEKQCALLYYYARLLFKREKKREAFEAFGKILAIKQRLSSESQEKIQALIDTRCAIENVRVGCDGDIKHIRYSGDKIEYLRVSEKYKANELASVFGRGLANCFVVDTGFSAAEKTDAIAIYNEHKRLIDRYPNELCKQEVVNTILQWYICLWCINTDMGIDDFGETIQKGFAQSKKRKNTIFYIQCSIAKAVFLAMNQNKRKAIQLLMLAVRLIKKEKLSITHEGISHLLLFLKQSDAELYAIVECAFKNDNGYSFENAICKYNSYINLVSWRTIFNNVEEIYSVFFNNEISNVYDVTIDSVLNSFS